MILRAVSHLVPCLLICCAVLPGCVSVRHNFRSVDAGCLYRSGQMSAGALRKILVQHEIQTVINLRGAHPEAAWWAEERAVCHALGVAHHDFAWTKDQPPAPDSLARYLDCLRQAKTPVLVHCHGGTHRAGVASACYLLLSGGHYGSARRQLDPLFGHAAIGRVIDAYQGSPLPFAAWVEDVYPALHAAWMAEERSATAKPSR